jgi:hypothetical protein
MDLNQQEQFRAKRLEKLRMQLNELTKSGISAEAAASLLVAAWVGDLSLELHLIESRMGELQAALAKKP